MRDIHTSYRIQMNWNTNNDEYKKNYTDKYRGGDIVEHFGKTPPRSYS